jgi:MFS family permease
MGHKASARRWRSVYSLAFGNAIDNADGKLLNFIFPSIRQALNMNLETLGILTSIGLLSRMLFGPLWALAGDRWNRKTLMFLVTGVWGIWTILAGLAQTELQFLVLYSIAALGTVATEPLTSSLTADLFPEADRGRAFGVLRGVGGLILLVFVPLGIVFTHFADGWRWALFTVGGLSMLSGVFVLLFVRDPGRGVSEVQKAPNERLHKGDLRFLWKTPSLWLMAASVTLITSLVIVSFALTFLTDIRGFGLAQAQIVMAIFGVTFAASSLVGGRLGDWAHHKAAHRGRILLMQVYLVAYAVLTYLTLQVAWPLWVYYPLFFVFGAIAGVGVPGAVMPLVSSVVLPETRSTAFGFLFSLVQGAVLALLTWIFPLLAERFGQMATFFWMTTVPYLVNAVLWFALYRTVPRDHDRALSELKRRTELASAPV